MVERSLHGLRDGWTINSIVDVRETGRRATGHLPGTPGSTGCAGRASRTTNERSHGSGAPTFSPPA
eukprot:346438-Prymnesium_polylepis.1